MRHHLVSVLVLAATWGVTLVTVLATGVQGSAREATIGLLCGGGLVASLFLRSVMASYVLAGVLAFLLAEIGAHAIWGLGSVQGGPTHLAVLAAACLGVAGSAVVSWVAAARLLERVSRSFGFRSWVRIARPAPSESPRPGSRVSRLWRSRSPA